MLHSQWDEVLHRIEALTARNAAWWDARTDGYAAVLDYAEQSENDPDEELAREYAFAAADTCHGLHHVFAQRLRWRHRFVLDAIERCDSAETLPLPAATIAEFILAYWDAWWLCEKLIPGMPRPNVAAAAFVNDVRQRKGPLEPIPTRSVAERFADRPTTAQSWRLTSLVAGHYSQACCVPEDLSVIARDLGIDDAELIEAFPDREHLLLAADELELQRAATAFRAGGTAPLQMLQQSVDWTENRVLDAPGTIQMLLPLQARAVDPNHPGHASVRESFVSLHAFFLDCFNALHEAGDLRPEVSPRTQAAVYMALWIGLRQHWMYLPDDIDPAAGLRAYLHFLLA